VYDAVLDVRHRGGGDHVDRLENRIPNVGKQPFTGAEHDRMGLHTGTPQIREGSHWGSDVHYAARLASAAHGGQILISASTRPLAGAQPVESLGEHAEHPCVDVGAQPTLRAEITGTIGSRAHPGIMDNLITWSRDDDWF
jgi:class 3 adenylate cyclase